MTIMTKRWLGRAVLVSLVLAGVACGAVRAAEAVPPNFVVLMAEAQGWAQTSVQMDDRVPASRSRVFSMPALERLARSGMRFTSTRLARSQMRSDDPVESSRPSGSRRRP